MLRECLKTVVGRLLRQWECERSLRECCETVDRTKTSLNSLQHPQQHSSDITPTILKHLTESFKNISQTSLKHLSTSPERLSNISQTSLNNTHQHPSNNLRQHHPNNNKPELSASTGRKGLDLVHESRDQFSLLRRLPNLIFHCHDGDDATALCCKQKDCEGNV